MGIEQAMPLPPPTPKPSHLDLAMRVLILSTFFCFSFISSGLRGVSGSSSMYRSGMKTLSGVESYGREDPEITGCSLPLAPKWGGRSCFLPPW